MDSTDVTATTKTAVQLRALGFCGVDDSIAPEQFAAYSCDYPWIEWGVLFRPDKEGTPRYASTRWVQRLAEIKKQYPIMKLAAHLCERRVNDLLKGKRDFIEQVQAWGFGRIQINATAVNGVDTSHLAEQVPNVLQVMQSFPELEFILQRNDETEPLWQGILDDETASPVGRLPDNVSMLLDESKGTGVLPTSWPTPPSHYQIGYAGGLGPDTIVETLPRIMEAASGTHDSIWIDMESRLRSKTPHYDVFSLAKCHQVNIAVCQAGLKEHPSIAGLKPF
jgi:hypothetical protein